MGMSASGGAETSRSSASMVCKPKFGLEISRAWINFTAVAAALGAASILQLLVETGSTLIVPNRRFLAGSWKQELLSGDVRVACL